MKNEEEIESIDALMDEINKIDIDTVVDKISELNNADFMRLAKAVSAEIKRKKAKHEKK